MRTGFHSWVLKYSFPILVNFCLILLSVTFVIIAFTEEPFTIEADVVKTHGPADTVQTFSDAAVLSAGKFYVVNAAPPLKYLAPRASIIDPLYSVLFFLCSIVLGAFFWDFTYKKPFTRKTLWGLRILAWLLLAFFLIDFFWRLEWFDEQVRQITSNQYSYEKSNPFASPLPWISAILIRLVWIIKSGLSLQKDAELTI